ncbi:uroporphyrinogen-III synthase [Candidatus Pelagibacter sp.]|nr:uroporphyrinogen-III synthase [Candidatus Pelagibacter sp.]
MHILLTRPLDDCLEMIVKFKSLGHEVSHLPLLNIEKLHYPEINFNDYKAIIFTSSNAIKFLETKKINKDILCFCVGHATEKKARNRGFQNIISAEGNVENLRELIIQNLNVNFGKILYISGELISTKLDQSLIQEGYVLKRVINYKTNHNQKFDEKFIEELKLKIPDIVYIYSQNSAQSFLNFIKNYQFEGLWMNTNLVCIGEKASSILNEIKWKKIFLFNPGEEEFLLYKI